MDIKIGPKFTLEFVQQLLSIYFGNVYALPSIKTEYARKAACTPLSADSLCIGGDGPGVLEKAKEADHC